MSILKEIAARAAAILTTGEVAAATLDLTKTNGMVSVDYDFTIGSLTNVVLRWYVSADGTTWVPIEDSAGNVSKTVTATATRAVIFDCSGWKNFRASAQGTGTVTSSTLTLKYRYRVRGR
jgi:hypothetical protein